MSGLSRCLNLVGVLIWLFCLCIRNSNDIGIFVVG
jgi:hypothetical protein